MSLHNEFDFLLVFKTYAICFWISLGWLSHLRFHFQSSTHSSKHFFAFETNIFSINMHVYIFNTVFIRASIKKKISINAIDIKQFDIMHYLELTFSCIEITIC